MDTQTNLTLFLHNYGNYDSPILIPFSLAPINNDSTIKETLHNNCLKVSDFNKLLQEYEKDNSKNPAKIIMENIINNFKLYAEMLASFYIDNKEYDNIKDLKPDNEKILYIKDFKELEIFVKTYVSIDKEDFFIYFLNDILVKLKLNTNIIIKMFKFFPNVLSSMSNSSEFTRNIINSIDNRRLYDENIKTYNLIEIGYNHNDNSDNNENRLYFKDLKDYNEENQINNLLHLIENTIHNDITLQNRKKIKESLREIFLKL